MATIAPSLLTVEYASSPFKSLCLTAKYAPTSIVTKPTVSSELVHNSF